MSRNMKAWLRMVLGRDERVKPQEDKGMDSDGILTSKDRPIDVLKKENHRMLEESLMDKTKLVDLLHHDNIAKEAKIDALNSQANVLMAQINVLKKENYKLEEDLKDQMDLAHNLSLSENSKMTKIDDLKKENSMLEKEIEKETDALQKAIVKLKKEIEQIKRQRGKKRKRSIKDSVSGGDVPALNTRSNKKRHSHPAFV